MKRSRISPVRRGDPRRRAAPRADANEWADLEAALVMRSPVCHWCGVRFTRHNPPERHHRLRRRDGGDRLANLLRLHRSCHAWFTEHPAVAVLLGVIVRTGQDPARIPVRLALRPDGRGSWYLLDDDGQADPCPPPPDTPSDITGPRPGDTV